ncbi:MAG: PadR family transcriptional regulator [Alphaproteobacteria bacterium]|nr:PadR family transcriptional regulator [Alphaproteobacteria bacterium]
MMNQPVSGYDIKQEFDHSLKHFWFAELSQIYPALKKLVREGLAEVHSAASEKGPDKKLYSRTLKGSEALSAWLKSEPATAPVRHGFMGQLFFMGNREDPHVALAFFQDLLAHFSARRKALEAVEANWKANDPSYPDKLPDEPFYMQMTLDIGLNLQKTYEDWCIRSIARIEARLN